MNSRAASSGASILVILTLMIVLYIIFLPPTERSKLLDDVKTPSQNTGGSSNSPTSHQGQLDALTFAGPGLLTSQSGTQKELYLSGFTLEGIATPVQLFSQKGLTIYATIFGQESKKMTFNSPSAISVQNPLLTFNVKKQTGTINIFFNDREVYSGNADVSYIALDPATFTEQNTLELSVESPGLAFWSKPTVELSDIKITASIIDEKTLVAKQLVYIKDSDFDQLKTARLRFFVECIQKENPIIISINGNVTYTQIPDCGQINLVSLSREVLKPGENSIVVTTKSGKYVFDQISIQTSLESDSGVTYYFTLADDYFYESPPKDAVCGEIDGVCPSGCSADLDKECCFAEYEKAYWCSVPTQLTSDRCVGRVDVFNANRCPSAYKDKSSVIAKGFEKTCGDDSDGVCPTGCSAYYDKNCCLVSQAQTYWCSDLPTGGVANKCLQELSVDQYAFCPKGYQSQSGTLRWSAPKRDDTQVYLKTPYKVFADFTFVDDDTTKRAEVIVNGVKTGFDTGYPTTTLDISRYVEDDSNYIRIIPESDFSLVKTRIRIEE
jgi:hypothetical protein